MWARRLIDQMIAAEGLASHLEAGRQADAAFATVVGA